ncbi:proline dehydrogenase family protein [Telmatocola sphagniphila]|uniref:L-glutamate gamma-semialdehyde dehydrogenase n=1 Tax=Telmatocola sphagniphila TaxID=1123043 RepID=A0A8E6B8M7_9BACT|nr:proline dehydrogenase family protein [Telmatocola sphagniphila]QVL33156.1 proline dehydrogenase family protein [Telmatocola sphagniphila]
MSSLTVEEERIRRYGREIFARMDRRNIVPFSPAWFDDVLMNTTMQAEKLKVQLFRFIDTLPLLKDSKTVADHLKEYLGTTESGLPGIARHFLNRLPGEGWAGTLLAKTAKNNAEHMARKFIAGSNVQEAISAIKQLRNRKYGFTIDLLGEATITEAEADGVQKQYFDLVEGLPGVINNLPEIPCVDRNHLGPIPRVNISVKLSSLFSQFDPIDPVGTTRSVLKRLRPIMSKAMSRGEFINFDMEQYSFKDTTLHIFKTVLEEPEFRNWPHVGIAIQAYLKDTEKDLQELLEWTRKRGTPIAVRLVKGAYWDYETVIAAQQDWPVPVWTEKWQSDACFERCGRFLLQNYNWIAPAFGSHNVRSISTMLAVAEELGVPKGAYEFQMLYGMADEFKDAMVELGQRIRIYTPYGQLLPGMAYLVRRLLENTSNDSFLRASFRENTTEDKLLMNPVHKAQANTTNGTTAAPSHSEKPGKFKNEPLAEYHREFNRDAMSHALAEVAKQLDRDYVPFIGGQAVAAEKWQDATNPSQSSQKLGRWAASTPKQAEEAIASAKKNYPAWRDTPAAKRAEYLRKIADVMRKRRWELSAWAVYETAKPWREADADIAEAIDFCDYYAELFLKMVKPKRMDVPGEENSYFYEPRGVAVVIAPWNFPLAIMCGMTVAALVTGNTVIIKPAEQSTIIGAKFAEVLKEAELPPVWSFLPGIGEEIGPTLVQSPDVDLIVFTGSQQVGLWINENAAKTPPVQHHVKRVIAELGGKNAAIVDADADLDEAVKGVLDSAFGYSGQKCSACSRAIVHESIHDQFLHRLIEAAKSLTISPASDPGCSMGPVIDADAKKRILAMIAKGKSQSLLVYAADLGALADQGHYVGPHIFADVHETDVIAQEEIFGPVLAVMKAKNLDHALQIANGTRYALTGGIFSRSPSTLERVKKEFRVGNLYVNRKITGALVERQPFGGFKLSGIGSKAGGPDYLLQFVIPRVITENTMRRGFAPTLES